MANIISRPDASSGLGYFGSLGTKLESTDVIAADSFFKVVAVGGTSAFPASMQVVDHVYHTQSAITLSAGDEAYAFTLSAPNFIQGMTRSGTRAEADVTAQNDANKTYLSSKFSEESGDVSGVFDINDSQLLTVIQKFLGTTSITDAGVATETDPNADPLYMFFTRNDWDSLDAGEDWVVDYIPMSLTGYSFDKPLEGGQPFSFNYRVRGSEFPAHFRITKD